MYINSKYDTPEKVLGFVNQTQGMFANNTQYAPILHELGHKYYYDSINKLAISQGIEYNKAKGIIDHRLYDYICENVLDKSISKQISTYAQLHYDKSNYTELIAESFSISGTSDVARALIELLKGWVVMMRHFTEEEKKLYDKLHGDKILSKEERERIVKRLKEIDEEQTKDFPFCH